MPPLPKCWLLMPGDHPDFRTGGTATIMRAALRKSERGHELQEAKIAGGGVGVERRFTGGVEKHRGIFRGLSPSRART